MFVRALAALLMVIALASTCILSFSAASHDGVLPEDLPSTLSDTLYVGSFVSSATVTVSTYQGSNFLLNSGAAFTGTARGFSHFFPLYDSSGGMDIGFEPYVRLSRFSTFTNSDSNKKFSLAIWDSSLLYDSFTDVTHKIPAMISYVEIHIADSVFASVAPISVQAGNGGYFYVFEIDIPERHGQDFTLWFFYDLLGYQDVYAFSQNTRFYGFIPSSDFEAAFTRSATNLLNFFDSPDLSFLDLSTFISVNATSLAGWGTFFGSLFDISFIKIPLLVCLALSIFFIFLSLSARIGRRRGD